MSGIPQDRVARAAAELVVIVIGILVALGVDAWWEARGDAARERVILSDLSAEFQANRTHLSGDIVGNEALLQATSAILDLGTSGLASLNADSLQSLVYRSLTMQTFDPSNAVLQSVLAAGEFAVISNPRLRAALAAWDDGLVELRRKQQVASDWHNTYLLPRIFSDAEVSVERVRSVLGMFLPHRVKHQNAVIQARKQLALADTVLAYLDREGR